MKGARGEITRLERLAETAPDRCTVIDEVARTWAFAGQYPETIAALQKVIDLNAGFDIARDSVFTKLRGVKEFEAIVQRAREATPPVITSRLAFKIAEGDLVPENLAFSPLRQEFYIGSTWKHKIIRCRAAGTCQPFADGLGIVLGLKVDTATRTLWALSNSENESALFHYDLASARLINKYVQTGAHVFNDLAIAAAGDVYLTDTRTGSIYRFEHRKNTLNVFGSAGKFTRANGIAISPDQRTLYVASFGDGISIVDAQSGMAKPIAKPPDLCLGYIDGLYAYQRSLIAIQNGPMTPRVIRLHLNRDGNRIERFEILERRNPIFDGITTGVIAGRDFCFVANMQDEKPKNATFDPIAILRITLKHDTE